jgi:hypothetical protein
MRIGTRKTKCMHLHTPIDERENILRIYADPFVLAIAAQCHGQIEPVAVFVSC